MKNYRVIELLKKYDKYNIYRLLIVNDTKTNEFAFTSPLLQKGAYILKGEVDFKVDKNGVLITQMNVKEIVSSAEIMVELTIPKLKKLIDIHYKKTRESVSLMFAIERLNYLLNSENLDHFYMAQNMFIEGTLAEHALNRAINAYMFIKKIKPHMKKRWGITKELKARDRMKWVGLINNLISTMNRMALKYIIYVD